MSTDDDPLAFTPVAVRARHDGWTPDRQRRFVQALAAMGVVAAAARAVGKSGTSAYRLRERADAASFARAWDLAETMAGDRTFEQAMDRAINGVVVPRFYRGQQVGAVRRPDYRLALKALDRHLRAPPPAIGFHEAMAALGEPEDRSE